MKAPKGKGKPLLYWCSSVVAGSQLDFRFLLRNLEGGWQRTKLQIEKGRVCAQVLLTTLLSLKTDMLESGGKLQKRWSAPSVGN